MDEHERADSERPAEEHQDSEEPRIGGLQAAGIADEIHAEKWIDHRLNRKRHELKRLERLVCELVPANLGEIAEVLKDRHIRPEVQVRQKEGECEGKGEWKPTPHQAPVESESHLTQSKDADHDQRVNDRE